MRDGAGGDSTQRPRLDLSVDKVGLRVRVGGVELGSAQRLAILVELEADRLAEDVLRLRWIVTPQEDRVVLIVRDVPNLLVDLLAVAVDRVVREDEGNRPVSSSTDLRLMLNSLLILVATPVFMYDTTYILVNYELQ